MKETRYFYAPDIDMSDELPEDEAAHCLRVLRLQAGDEIFLTNGRGTFCRAEITTATGKRCRFRILSRESLPSMWNGHLHLAVAPTKNNDRMEWLAEKATEIGFDELSFLNCRYSERKVMKNERIDKILVSAMKQSHKAKKPLLNGITPFGDFVKRPFTGQKFIAHCYDEADICPETVGEVRTERTMDGGKPLLSRMMDAEQDALVLIGPEGDFSIDEVRLALSQGFRSVSLGSSRLRTETAALVAVHLMNLSHAR